MASSIINSDDGVVSGTSGLKTTGGDDGSLKIQANGTDAISIAANGAVTLSAGALPVASGGTGATSLTANSVILGNGTSAVQTVAAGTNGNVLTSNGTTWVSQAISAGGDYVMQVYNSPATWTKPAGLKAVKVTVVGGGGGGARTGVSGSAGSTSSFGPLASATGGEGGTGPLNPGAGGIGSGGDINTRGNLGNYIANAPGNIYWGGGPTIIGNGGIPAGDRPAGAVLPLYGGGGGGTSSGGAAGGGGGAAIKYLDAPAIPGPISVTVGAGGAGSPNPAPGNPERQAGATGVVIVEEFY